MKRTRPDCVVIGYYEPPFEQYERLIRRYGTGSEAYRDLQFNFVRCGSRALTFTDLLNRACRDARGSAEQEPFRSGDIPNVAAVYLTNFLRRRGFDVEYINLFMHEQDRLADYLAASPRCVAITTTFYTLNQPVIEIVDWIRRHNSEVPIVVGGPLVANHARQDPTKQQSLIDLRQGPSTSGWRVGNRLLAAAEDMGADIYVVESQGELTLARLLGCLRDGGGLGTVPNLVYRDRKEWRVTAPVAENNPLDECSIDWSQFGEYRLGHTLQTRTARSCAFNCSFCNYPTRAGKLALASVETIERELDAMQRLGDVTNVVFIDDTFNVPLDRFKNICRMMIRRRYGFNWFSYFRCSNADEEAVALAAESGCKAVFLGIESGSRAILTNMNKAATIEKYAQGIQWLRSNGVLTFGSFITGFPGETSATVRETIDFINDSRLDFYRSQLWYCERGTPIQLQRERFGIEGQGFTWRHATMTSGEAMDHIEGMFLEIETSTWLPQWSFDFWIVPYLLGKGLTLDAFKQFMTAAHNALALEIARMTGPVKAEMQREYLRAMSDALRGCHIEPPGGRNPRAAKETYGLARA